MSLKSIWVIGDWQEPVFEESVAWLRSHADCQFLDLPTEGSVGPTNGRYPQAIVFVQSRPGQFSAQRVENCHSREPLARLVMLTGPWCEGEQRSGKPIAVVTRVAWRNWRERLPMELAMNDPMSLAPRTATETERLERMVQGASEPHNRRGLALVCAAKLETYRQIADVFQKLGIVVPPYDTCTDSSVPPDVIVFDGWEQASAFKKRSTAPNGKPHARRILLLHFPRPEDHNLAHEVGIDVVAAQPLSLADLKSAVSSTTTPA